MQLGSLVRLFHDCVKSLDTLLGMKSRRVFTSDLYIKLWARAPVRCLRVMRFEKYSFLLPNQAA